MLIILFFFDGRECYRRSVTEKNQALTLCNDDFCLVRRSEDVSFKRAIEELKSTFETVDKYISNEKEISHFKNEYNPKIRKSNNFDNCLRFRTV